MTRALAFVCALLAASPALALFRNAKTDCGAVGDGTTDDTTALRACVSAIAADGGGTLYFPEGTYVLTRATLGAGTAPILDIPTDTLVYGDGPKSILRMPTTFDAEVTIPNNQRMIGAYTTGVETRKSIHIRNLSFDGDFDSSATCSSGRTGNHAIYFESASGDTGLRNVSVKNVWIRNVSGDGVYFGTGVNAAKFVSSEVRLYCNAGVEVAGTGLNQGVFVSKVIFEGHASWTSDRSVYVHPSGYLLDFGIADCTVFDADYSFVDGLAHTGGEVYGNITMSTVKNARITEVSIEYTGTSEAAIYCYGFCEDTSLTTNHVISDNAYGILFLNNGATVATRASLTGNTFYTTDADSLDAIYLSATTRATVTGSRIIGQWRNGIVLDGVKNSAVEGNLISVTEKGVAVISRSTSAPLFYARRLSVVGNNIAGTISDIRLDAASDCATQMTRIKLSDNLTSGGGLSVATGCTYE